MSAPSTPGARHLLIRASAGSGKTYRLSTRYVALLATGADPGQILATTFTRKAAGEIFERVVCRLAAAALDPQECARLEKDVREELKAEVALGQSEAVRLLRRVTSSLHRVRVLTLDAFFHQAAAGFAPELGLLPNAEIADFRSPRVKRMRREALAEALETPSRENLVTLLLELNKDRTSRSVTENLDKVLEATYELFLESGPGPWERFETEGRELTEPERAALASRLEALRDDLAATYEEEARRNVKPKTISKKLVDAVGRHVDLARAGDWDRLTGGAPIDQIFDKKTKFDKKEIPDRVLEVYGEVVQHALHVITRRVRQQTRATADLMGRFAERFERRRLADRVLFFSDYPRLIASHGLENPELYFRLDSAIRHLLLDEFQDTSPVQWQVIRPIAEEIAAGDGSTSSGDACGRSFFCVGDVKQAIYGWRGGYAALFDQVQRGLRLGEGERLDESYRSSQIVLDAVNELFGKIAANAALTMQNERPWLAEFAAAWGERFREHKAAKCLEGYVELSTSPAPQAVPDADGDAGDGDDDGTDAETQGVSIEHAEHVVEKVERILRERPDSSVGILVRTNVAAQDFLLRLARRRIPASGESGNPLYSEPLVAALLAALHLADHPADTAHAYLVATSPLEQLYPMREALHAPPGEDRDAWKAARRKAVAEAARRIREEIARDGFRETLQRWARVLAPHADKEGIASGRIERVLEMAGAWTPAEPYRYREFLELVESTNVAEVMPARVRVMTVHKSKGLEFDVVVLPQLDPAMVKVRKQICVQRTKGSADIELIVRKAPNEEMLRGEVTKAVLLAEMEAEFNDSLSGLYVAMTRARHALYMIIPPLKQVKDDAHGGIGAAGHHTASWAALLRMGLSDLADPLEEKFSGPKILYRRGDDAWRPPAMSADAPVASPPAPLSPAERLLDRPYEGGALALAPSPAVPRRFLKDVTPSGLAGRKPVGLLRALAGTWTPGALSRGSFVHRWFEAVSWIEEWSADDDELAQMARECIPGESESFIRKCLAEFRGWMKRDFVKATLTRPKCASGETVDEPWREREFAVAVEGMLVHGQFDRVVVVRKGGKPVRAIVTDFKTDAVEDEAGMDEKVEHYRPQVEAYRKALVKMLGLAPEQVTAQLLFVERGARIVN